MAKDKKNKIEIVDPHAKREAEKYENPIPSREYILDVLTEKSQSLTFEEFAEILKLEDDDSLEALRRRLRAMERDGQLIRNRKRAYGNVKQMDLIRGRVIGHPDGFGFLVPDDGGDDLFLSAKRMQGVMHGDRIVARVSGVDRKGRREGAPVEVLEYANHQVVGRFHQEYGVSFVEPSNKRMTQSIMIPPEFRAAALDGQIVVADIVEQPTWRSKPIGKIVEVLGDHMAPGMEIDIAVRTYELPEKFPAEVVNFAKLLPKSVPEESKENRIDIRHLPLVTIDGEDARDFDDAVYCEKKGRYWTLYVAIADVSSYVKPESAIDKEAQNRGNSVYFPGKVIPMLPEELSNGLCSLNPHVDRLCMVCEMQLTQAANVKSYKFYEAVMQSSARLTYTEVAAAVVDKDDVVREQHKGVLPHLEDLYELYQAFAAKRKKRGVIEFDSNETRIIFGENRKIDKILPVVRNDAHKLIEEFMIAANVAAAEYLESHEMPALYRVHNGPTEEKLADLRAFLAEHGLRLGGGQSPEPKHYAALLDSIKDRPDRGVFEIMFLRSLSQAVYCPDNAGHFGLAFDAYTHFTSPIRRYPDLLVHRAIKHLVKNKKPKGYRYSLEKMENFGETCSMTERRADDATRDALDWLKTEYMQDKVGQVFTGKITTVTSFGVFVLLDEAYVEGLVHITALDNDYYHFDPVKQRLVGERTKKIYRLQDPITIKVVRADLEEKKIDFEPVLEGDQKSRGGKVSKTKSRKSNKTGGGREGFKRPGSQPKRKKSSSSKKRRKK